MSEPLTLALDASTYTGTAALVRGSELLGAVDVPMRVAERETLLPAVAGLLHGAGVRARDVRRVVCGDGPGRFTSLRIAAATAKGIAVGSGAELHAVPSLLLIIVGNELVDRSGRYVAVLDALRGEVHAAAYEVSARGDVAELDAPDLDAPDLDAPAVIARDAMTEHARLLGARIVGPDTAPAWLPHARGVARLGTRLGAATVRELATWEPCYGRPAEAQARWEREHGRPLGAT